MVTYPEKQQRLRLIAIAIAFLPIFFTCLELVLGILKRASSFDFNVTSLEGNNEGPEAELSITVTSKSVVDVLTIIVAIMLLVGIIRRKVSPVLTWILYTISRITWEVTLALMYSPTWIPGRLAWWFCYVAIEYFIVLNLWEICEPTPVRPSLSEPCLQDNPPTYEDVVPICINMESEAASGQDGSPPPYRPI